MRHIDTTRAGRIYQSSDLIECYEFCMMYDGQFSAEYYEDFIKGIFTVVI